MSSNEPTLNINVYNKPDMLEDSDADAIRIFYIVIGRTNAHMSKDICFDLRRFRFSEIINSKSKIEVGLRNNIDRIAPDIYLDSITVTQVSERKIHLGVKIIKDGNDRKEIFFSIRKDNTDKLLIDLLK